MLFWLAVAVFIVAVPVIIGYARGFRFDFERGNLSQVGAIRIETEPKNAQVIVNNKRAGKDTPTIIRNLLPLRTYIVRVEKEGYKSWEKTLRVDAEMITTAKNIVLFPDNLDFSLLELDSRFSLFFLSPNGENILGLNRNGELFIFDPTADKDDLFTLLGGLKISRVENVEWSENSSRVVFSRPSPNRQIWYLFNTATNETINLTNLYERNLLLTSASTSPLPRLFDASKIVFLNNGGEQIVVQIDKKLLVIDVEDEMLSSVDVDNVEAVAARDGQIFAFKSPDILLRISDGDSKVELEGNLRFFPQEIKLSPDGKKLVFFHDFNAGVIWLEDTEGGPLKKRGEQEIVLHPIHRMHGVQWHSSSEYLMAFLENGEFIVGELDGRDTRNEWSWRPENTLGFEYASKEKSLWFITSDNTLLRHEGEF